MLMENSCSTNCFLKFVCHSYGKASCRVLQNNYSTSARTLSKACAKTGKFIVYCNAQITKNGRSGKIDEAVSLFNRMPHKNVVSFTAMVSAFADNGQITKARKLFEEMPERTPASWNAMITAYIRNMNRRNGIGEAYRLFLQMPCRNAKSYSAMLVGFVNAGMLDEAERLYERIPLNWRDPFCSNILINGYLKLGKLEEAVKVFDGMLDKNVVTWSSMVDGYCKHGRVHVARKLFDVMEETRNEFTWCAMINGYMKAGCFEDGFQLFIQMRRASHLVIGPTILTVMLESCGRYSRYQEGFQVLGLVVHQGFFFDLCLSNSIVSMFSRFGCIKEARSMFDTLSEKDVVSWNSLIYGYVKAGRLEEASELFEKAEEKDSVTWTTLITGFSNKGLIEKCIDLFNMMPEKDDVAWTALISGLVDNLEHEEAFCWFIQMLRHGIRPNPLTLSSLLSASAGLSFFSHGVQVHALVYKLLMQHDLSVQNSLISMYSKCGSVNDAFKIFKSITSPNIVSFNSMLTGFAHNGHEEEALLLFKQLVDGGWEPNEVTFLGVLSACTHGGLVDEGWEYFRSMSHCFQVEPGPDHYTCMVDLLGRAGLLDEAINFIKSIPFKPYSGLWGALLGASRTHKRLDLANLAAQNILELEPHNAAAYVVLSDVYSFMGKRREEEQLRLSKTLRGIKKSPGCSWITMKDKVNLFLSGDKSHANFEEIKTTLWLIINEMTQIECVDCHSLYS